MSGHRPFRLIAWRNRSAATGARVDRYRLQIERTDNRPWWRLIRLLDRLSARLRRWHFLARLQLDWLRGRLRSPRRSLGLRRVSDLPEQLRKEFEHASVQSLSEYLAECFRLTDGPCRLLLVFVDGKLRYATPSSKISFPQKRAVAEKRDPAASASNPARPKR